MKTNWHTFTTEKYTIGNFYDTLEIVNHNFTKKKKNSDTYMADTLDFEQD
jgi:hypothetical protein